MVNPSKGDGGKQKDAGATSGGTLDEKLAQNKQDMEALVKNGINDIKQILGEQLSGVGSKLEVCTNVLRDLVIDVRAAEYHRAVDEKLSRNATLVFSRTKAGEGKETTAKDIGGFIDGLFPSNEAPGFTIDPMGKKGSFRLYPQTFSPIRSRQICANILHVLKEADFRTKFGMNVFYDNPVFLRQIRSDALRFVAEFLQSEGIKLTDKPFVKKNVMMLNGLPMFSEFLVPLDEGFWPSAYPFLASTLRSPALGAVDALPTPLVESQMRDLFVAAKGLLFPNLVGGGVEPMIE
jgi:hypothetical protein